MATHELKTWPEPFRALWEGRKTAEFRRDDREPRYAVGDRLHLKEWIPDGFFGQSGEVKAFFTGRMIAARVTDVRRESAFGIPPGFAMLSLGEMTRHPRDAEGNGG
jgi:ASC-1-like (ASCH) protein